MSYRKDGSAFFSFVGIALLIGSAVFWSPCNGGDVSIGYPHELSGEVVSDPTTRYIRGGDGGQEKVALTVRYDTTLARTMSDADMGDGTAIIECVSTRCTQIKSGERHVFKCRGDGRLLEPNVVVCKHVSKER